MHKHLCLKVVDRNFSEMANVSSMTYKKEKFELLIQSPAGQWPQQQEQ